MADVKISALPLATTPLAGTEVLPIVQSATTDQVSVANLTAGRAVSAASLTLTTTPLAVGSGGTGLTSLTAGYVPFGAGTSAFGNDSNLFWDNTNKRLGVGTASPIDLVDIYKVSSSTAYVRTANNTLKLSADDTAGNTSITNTAGTNLNIGTLGLSAVCTFQTNNTERMRIAPDGSVGIGTTSPAYKLDITSTASRISNFNSTNANGGGIAFQNSGTINGYLGSGKWLTGGNLADFGINVSGANNLILATNDVERARIDASGNLLVGTTSSASFLGKKLVVATGGTSNEGITVYSSSNNGSLWFANATSGSGAYHGGIDYQHSTNVLTFYSNSTGYYVLDGSGNIYPGIDNAQTCGKSGNRWSAVWAANGTIQTSDLAQKTDVKPSPLGIEFIKKLNPVAYKFKIGGNIVQADPDKPLEHIVTPIPGKRQHFGFIAQEVKAILPEGVDFGGWVKTNLDDPNSEEGLRYEQFIAPLVKAVQELAAKIAELEAKI